MQVFYNILKVDKYLAQCSKEPWRQLEPINIHLGISHELSGTCGGPTFVAFSWAGCLRRTESGIFFRTRVTPLGFSFSFFTRLALLQPTCRKE